MTSPDEAKESANAALERATAIRDRALSIGEKWRASRTDNNFRQMLRQIGKAANNAPSS